MKYIAFLAALIAALTLSPPAAAAADWSWPVRGDVITPYKNGDDPYAGGQHRGIDIAAPVGTRVNAAVGGRVTFAGVAGSSGLTVNVRTGDGRFDVSYLHLSSARVHDGDPIERGDVLGAVGTSGSRSADQPHLHFGVREAGDRHAYRDPLDFLPPLAPPVPDPPAAAPVRSPTPMAAPPAAAPALARPPAPLAPDSPPPLPAPVATPAAVPAPGPGRLPVEVTTEALAPLPAPTALVGDLPAAPDGHASAAPGSSRASRTPRHTAAVHAAARDSSASAPPAPHGSARAAAPTARRHGSPVHRTISSADLDSPAAPAGAQPDKASTDQPQITLPDRPASSRGSDGALDAGWLAAVIGLVAASLCLSRPQQARRAVRGGRGAIGAVLRPLTGRH